MPTEMDNKYGNVMRCYANFASNLINLEAGKRRNIANVIPLALPACLDIQQAINTMQQSL